MPAKGTGLGSMDGFGDGKEAGGAAGLAGVREQAAAAAADEGRLCGTAPGEMGG